MLYAHLFHETQASIKQELGHYDLDFIFTDSVCIMTAVVMRVKAVHEANFVIGDYPLIISSPLRSRGRTIGVPSASTSASPSASASAFASTLIYRVLFDVES